MDIRKVKKLIEMMQESDINEIEIKEGEESVRISRGNPGNMQEVSLPASQFMVSESKHIPVEETLGRRLAPRTLRRSGSRSDTRALSGSLSNRPTRSKRTADTKTEESPGHFTVKAPMVGTFYQAPDPDSAPFVEVGAQVNEGDTLCIIESMKMMNQVLAECSGVLEKILVDDADGVEYDQSLFVVKAAP